MIIPAAAAAAASSSLSGPAFRAIAALAFYSAAVLRYYLISELFARHAGDAGEVLAEDSRVSRMLPGDSIAAGVM
jgi:hypothetical protein